MNSSTKNLLALGALAAAGGMAVNQILRSSRWFDFKGKVAIITGGSRGLGLVLARQLIDRGARVAICARESSDLTNALNELQERGGEVIAIPCDIRDQAAVESMVQEVIKRFGTIDLLFNVAGIIQVGPLDSMTMDDFRDAMETNCWGPLQTTLAVLPEFRKKGWGRIVNIASVGGKRAVPHLLPYAASKFALVGLSNGLRVELWKENIFVTTVCPSLMNTGSPRNAVFKGQNKKEYAWFSIGDSIPVISMDANLAAKQTLKACQYGDREVILRNPLNIAVLAQSLLPGFTQELLALMDRVLPEMGGIGRRAARGHESQSAWSPSWLTYYGELAARMNNEMHYTRPAAAENHNHRSIQADGQ